MSKPKATTNQSTTTATTNPASAAPAGPENAPYKNNPEVDRRIDQYIKDNPKHWAYIQGMSRERLERSVVLNELRELDRQQRMREGLLNRVAKDPALKQAYDTLVKDVPEDQREAVMARLVRQQERTLARTRGVTQEPSSGMKV